MLGRIWLSFFIVALLLGCAKSAEEKLAAHKAKAAVYQEQGKIDEAVIELRNAVQLAPEDVDSLFELATLQLAKGSPEDAFQRLRKVVEVDPTHVEAQLQLGRIYLLGNSAEEARARAEAVIAHAPERPDGYLLLGQALVKLGEVDEGLGAVDRGIALAPGEVNHQMIKAALLLSGGRANDARATLEAVLKDYPSHKGALFLMVRVAEVEGEAAGVQAAVERLVAGVPKDPEAWMIAGTFWASQRAPAKAIAAYRKAAELDPERPTAWEKIGETALKAKDRAPVEEAASVLLGKDSRSSAGIYFSAALLLMDRRYAEAEVLLQDLVRDRPNSAEAWHALGAAHYGQGNLQLARADLQKAVDLAPQLVEARVLLARVHLDSRNFELALAALEPLSKREEVPADAVFVRGMALLGQRKPSEARQNFERLLAVVPNHVRAQEQIGLCYMAEGKPDEALKAFEKALELDPTYLPAVARSVEVLAGRKRFDQATALVRDHMAKTRETAAARHLLAGLYAVQGDRTQARAELERAVELDPGAAESYILLARLHEGPAASEAALADVEKALAARPNYLQGWMLKGMLHDHRGEFEQANAAYRKVLELDERHVTALNNLAWNLSKKGGNLDEALKFAERAVGLAPTQPAVNDTLGFIYVGKGVYRKALQHLDIAAAALPDSPEVQYHLALAYAGLDDKPKAVEALEKALRLSQDFDGAAEAKELLAKLKE